jgi:hypothetical protein
VLYVLNEVCIYKRSQRLGSFLGIQADRINIKTLQILMVISCFFLFSIEKKVNLLEASV